jgi:lysophospholipase L1-like esterase
MSWTGSQLVFRCEAAQVVMGVHSEPGELDPQGRPWPVYLTVLVDSGAPQVMAVHPETQSLTLATDLGPGAHTVQVFKRTEALTGGLVLTGLTLGPGGQLLAPPPRPLRHIEMIGNSITCGYGNLGESRDCKFSADTEDGYQAYGALAARRLGAAYTAVCYSGRGISVNYGGSTEGTLLELYQQVLHEPGGPRYDFDGPAPSVVVINLGTNDFAGRIPDRIAFVDQYVALAQLIRQHYPDAGLVLLTGPMHGGERLATLRRYVDEVAAALQQAGQARVWRLDLTPQGPLGYGCDYHPNLAQHELNAQELIDFLATRID